MKSLFEEVRLGKMTLKNRFVRSATWEGMCDSSGTPTERLSELYENLAEGGVGLILTGYAYVGKEGKQLQGKLGIYDDSRVPPLKKMVKRVHGKGGRIAVQIVHAGGRGAGKSSGTGNIAPSSISATGYPEVPAEMTEQDIGDVAAAFGMAAERAREAGFDGVQLHGAHGFLISQFLSPLTNVRDDEYGGSLENRSRFLVETYRAVRDRVGYDYPVLIKINADDFLPGGFSFGEALQVVKTLEELGIDGVEVSGGTAASGEKTPARIGILELEQEAYHREYASILKKQVGIPIILVGGLRSFPLMEEILEAEDADLFSMSRPFIREPGLVNRWKSGDMGRARCISCNGCFLPGTQEGGIYCVMEKRPKEK